MENASKALMIAGGVLIAILVLTIGVTLYISAKGLAEEHRKMQEIEEIERFNLNFTKFQSRVNISAQEIATLYNFVKKNKLDVRIEVINDSNFPGDDIIKFIKEANDKGYSYEEMEMKDDNGDGKYDYIAFKKN